MILSPFPHRIYRKKSVVFFRAEGARKLAPLKFKVLQSLNKFYETLRTFVRFTRVSCGQVHWGYTKSTSSGGGFFN